MKKNKPIKEIRLAAAVDSQPYWVFN